MSENTHTHTHIRIPPKKYCPQKEAPGQVGARTHTHDPFPIHIHPAGGVWIPIISNNDIFQHFSRSRLKTLQDSNAFCEHWQVPRQIILRTSPKGGLCVVGRFRFWILPEGASARRPFYQKERKRLTRFFTALISTFAFFRCCSYHFTNYRWILRICCIHSFTFHRSRLIFVEMFTENWGISAKLTQRPGVIFLSMYFAAIKMTRNFEKVSR